MDSMIRRLERKWNEGATLSNEEHATLREYSAMFREAHLMRLLWNASGSRQDRDIGIDGLDYDYVSFDGTMTHYWDDYTGAEIFPKHGPVRPSIGYTLNMVEDAFGWNANGTRTIWGITFVAQNRRRGVIRDIMVECPGCDATVPFYLWRKNHAENKHGMG